MRSHSYGERDYAFGQVMVTLRTVIGLTQVGLAQFLGISRGAVQRWEAGSSYPKAEHLKQLIALGIERQAFAPEREEEEIRALWQAAHQKLLLDEVWLSTLLGERPSPLLRIAPGPIEGTREVNQPVVGPAQARRVDWDDAQDVPIFYGRHSELATLSQWVVQERCRVVSMLGMGGIGKSALVVTLMHQVAEHFEVVLFRSLRDAPSCEALLDDCLQVLSSQPLVSPPESLQGRLGLLLKCLRERRALLVLDNLEALLQEGERGHYRPGYEGFGQMLRRVGETAHQSCLLVTSREKPVDLVLLEGMISPVRALRLAGLEADAGAQVLAEKEVVGTREERARLVETYAGNPLALKVVAETIADLFAGEIALFLKQGTIIFGSIQELLAEQITRLSLLEQGVLLWLAIACEPLGLDELLALLAFPLSQGQLLEAMDRLRRRSLIERGKLPGSLTLQSVVLEYVTGLLIEEVTSEIDQQKLDRLIEHGLSQAGAKEYVRQTQERLILAPIVARLRRAYPGRGEVEERLLALLVLMRERAEDAQGYGPANLVALLRELCGHLRGLDLSQLVLRGANLQGVEMQDASLAGATVHGSVFSEALDASWKVTISKNGQYWAAGSRRGKVRVWREAGQTLHLLWQAHTDTVSALAFAPDGSRLASGSWDGTITLWELEGGTLSGGQVSPLWSVWQTNSVQSLAFTPDGRRLASSSGNDTAVRLWDLYRDKPLQTLPHPAPVFSVIWSPDGQRLATGCLDGCIRLWEMQAEKLAVCVATLSGHSNLVRELAFAPHGRRLASAGSDRLVIVWDLIDGTPPGCYADIAGAWMAWPGVRTAHGSPAEEMRATSTCGMPPTARCSRSCKDIAAWSPAWCGVRMAAGLPAVAGAEAMGSCSCGKRLRPFADYPGSVLALDWSPRGNVLVSGSSDGMLRWWDVQSGESVRTREAHQGAIQSLRISPDGHRLASCGDDGAIQVWDLESGELLRTLRRDRLYERLNITGVKGLTEAQKDTLRALGAIEATLTSRTISSGQKNIFYFIEIALETIYTRNIFLLYINNGCDNNKYLT